MRLRTLAALLLTVFLIAPLHAQDKPTSKAKSKKAEPAKPPAPKPDPDVVIFTNGDQLSGLVERIVGKSLTFKSDMAGEITIDLDKVKELHSNGSYALIRGDAVKKIHFDRASIPTGTVSYADKKITVADPVGEAETIDPGKVAFIIDQQTFDNDVARQAHWNEGWTGSVTGGATVVLATQNSQTFTGAIALQRLVPMVTWLPKSGRTTFNLAETYGKVTQAGTPAVLTSIFHTDAENDRYVSARYYYLGELAIDHNNTQGLNLAQNYGAGLGLVAVQKPNKELDLKVDLHFLQQNFVPPTVNENLIGSSFTESYKQTLPHKIVFTQALSAIPAWNYETAFTATASAGLVMPVYKRFSMSLSTTDSFLNDPGVGYNKNSFQVVTGISYTLK